MNEYLKEKPNLKSVKQKINSVLLCLMAHPDNEPNSEFADRINDLIDVSDYITELKNTINN